MLMSILLGFFFLRETHPDLRPHQGIVVYDQDAYESDLLDHAPLLDSNLKSARAFDLETESYGTFEEPKTGLGVAVVTEVETTSLLGSITEERGTKVFTGEVSALLIAFCFFIYLSMSYDHLFPIYLQDDPRIQSFDGTGLGGFSMPGGLGLSAKAVGVFLSIDGLFAIFTQAVLFPPVVGWLGVWPSLICVTILHPVALFVVPLLSLLPSNHLTSGIYGVLILRNLLSIMAYPLLTVLIKRAAPSCAVLGRINGMSASLGAACRTLAPPLAGCLYDLGIKLGFTPLAWWVTAGIALVGTVQLLCVPRQKKPLDDGPDTA